MKVYTIGLLSNSLPNGVDNAQGYREKILKDLKIDNYYIFFTEPTRRDIYYYNSLDIPVNKMISPYHLFTGRNRISLCDRKHEIIDRLKKSITFDYISKDDLSITFYKDNNRIAVIALDEMNCEYVKEIYFYKNECLLRKENYMDGLFNAELFETAKDSNGNLYAKPLKKVFYNRDGSFSFEIINGLENKNILFKDGKKYNYVGFIKKYFNSLSFSKNDVIINDRPNYLDFTQPLFECINDAKLICFLHSEHFFENQQDPTTCVNLNYEYYYFYKYSYLINTFIVSTKEQQERLEENLVENGYVVPNIHVIPVGYINKKKYPSTKRKKDTVITVSRLDYRKKIGLVIKSVYKAHQKNSNINIDIFGTGQKEQVDKLHELVDDLGASEYIHFKGHVNVDDIYKDYSVYLTTSLWETFGLSLMEACGSGCAFVGLDVRYGNRLFIKNDKNGYLIPYKYVHDNNYDDIIAEEIANTLLHMFSDEDKLIQFNEASYKIASDFMYNNILLLWEKELKF